MICTIFEKLEGCAQFFNFTLYMYFLEGQSYFKIKLLRTVCCDFVSKRFFTKTLTKRQIMLNNLR
jgi:hypothetical protein